MMRVSPLQLGFGVLMLLPVAFATDQLTEDVNVVHHGSCQGGLAGPQVNFYDALHMFMNRVASGIFLPDVSATEATKGRENLVAGYPTIVKRKDKETGHSKSTKTKASLSPTESITVDTSTQTKVETTSDEPSTTGSPTNSAFALVSPSTSSSIKGTTTGTSDSLASTSPNSTSSSSKSSTDSTLTTKKRYSYTSTTHTTTHL
ncbi:hypothetical protein N7486_010596 [Penicillium sp. IBT 16267x]|nr:hypothetical protein N7486_010596 [Penicillium sp. IBT 16267x]